MSGWGDKQTTMMMMQEVLERARVLIGTGRTREGAELAWRAVQALTAAGVSQGPDLASAWLMRGNALRDMRAAGVEEAYTAAAAALAPMMGQAGAEEVNLLANIWTNRGMALMGGAEAEELRRALGCFEKAVALREGLPLEASPLYPWGLAAAWLNRAEVLSRLEQRAEAVACFDEALKVLGSMEAGAHPSLQARTVLGWMNRGMTLLMMGRLDEAMASLNQAVNAGKEPDSDECRRVLVGTLVNRSQMWLLGESPKAAQAREDAAQALGWIGKFERRELLSADLGVKARHLLCRALTMMPTQDRGEDWVTEATDAVDEGLELARWWHANGEPGLNVPARELFRFGTRVYQVLQPHFLAEFILDSVDPQRSNGAPVDEPAMHHIAVDALWSAVVAIREAAKSANGDLQLRLLETLDEMQQVEVRLGELREVYLQTPAENGAAAMA